jgi:transcriptional regulator with XRE-family HTH domain
MKTFGERLRRAREDAGYHSAQQFANILGQEPHTYRHWERGDSEPDFENLTRICELLDVTPNELLPYAAQKGGAKEPKMAKPQAA